ncbi:MAG: hypothetical protein NW224_17710 [Leptolyngbyaceae cyanobacterium bins.302]|nr:hypothetical protein [Leptolyngbyaceae cyanobacterium bins.302]
MTAHIPVLPGVLDKQSCVQLHPTQDTLREAATTLEALLISLSLTEAGKAFLASPPQTALQERVHQRLQDLETVDRNIAEAMEKLIKSAEILRRLSSSKSSMQAKSGANHNA